MAPRTVAVAIVVIAILFAGSVFLYQQRSTLDLVPRAERFTELYFENSSAFPQVTVAHQPMVFAFTIHNEEGVTSTYNYDAYFEYPNGDTVRLATGTIVLADGASTTIRVLHTFLNSGLSGKVVVELPSQGDQSIDFLLAGKK